MYEEGGNAVDALVAAAFTAFVVEPSNCGLGGYGHLALFLPQGGGFLTIDHSARAPGSARPDMFELDTSAPTGHYEWPRVREGANEWGGRAAAVPGALAGVCAAHEQGGRLPLRQVLEPAIETADAGLPVTWDLLLVIAERLGEIRQMPDAAAFLLADDDPPKAVSYYGSGHRLDTSQLAETLRGIARDGARAFYEGPAAAAIARAVADAEGGGLTAQDLAGYSPRIIRESPASYRGLRYVTAYDQVGYEVLNILDRFPLANFGPADSRSYHLIAEAFAHAFVDNVTYYGDPEHARSPVVGLASAEFAARRAAELKLDTVARRPLQPADPWPFEPDARPAEAAPPLPSAGAVTGTTQIATADGDGNMAALITTIGYDFGSLVFVPEVGIFLNNGMVNFDPRPDRANCVAPGKMPFFAVPSIVATRDGRAVFAACGSGGYRILSGVVHAFVNVVDFGMSVEAAVEAPRVFSQGLETFVDGRVPADAIEGLRAAGHDVVVQETTPAFAPFARVSAVVADPASGELSAGSDPPWSTSSL